MDAIEPDNHLGNAKRDRGSSGSEDVAREGSISSGIASNDPLAGNDGVNGMGTAPEGNLISTFMANRERLARFIGLRCGGADVDDLVHELWLKVSGAEASIEKPLAYLYRMADRLVMDSRRGASRSRSREGDWAHAHGRLSDAVEPALAERRILARERLRGVDEALRATGERAALIFRRYRLDGVSQRDIAEELGVSISTVEKDLRKIYDALLSIGDHADEE
jgi:RNA polymerase sigma-70 factor (ECF subfamily)